MSTKNPSKSQTKKPSHTSSTVEKFALELVGELGSCEAAVSKMRRRRDEARETFTHALSVEKALSREQERALKSVRRPLRKIEIAREKFLGTYLAGFYKAKAASKRNVLQYLPTLQEFDREYASLRTSPEKKRFEQDKAHSLKSAIAALAAYKKAEADLENAMRKAEREAKTLFTSKLAAETEAFERARADFIASFKPKLDAAAKECSDAKARADNAQQTRETILTIFAEAFALEVWKRRLPNASAKQLAEIVRHFPTDPKEVDGITTHSSSISKKLLVELNKSHGWSADLETGYGFKYAYYLHGGSRMTPEETWRKTGEFTFHEPKPEPKPLEFKIPRSCEPPSYKPYTGDWITVAPNSALKESPRAIILRGAKRIRRTSRSRTSS